MRSSVSLPYRLWCVATWLQIPRTAWAGSRSRDSLDRDRLVGDISDPSADPAFLHLKRSFPVVE